MKDRYKQSFEKAHKEGRKAFIPFTVLGWPNPERCVASIKAMIDGGATALELGIPFSDPVADGPIIQAASFEALDNGFTLSVAFDIIKQVRAYNADIPIGLLMYYNVVLSKGVANFYKAAAEAGVDSVLIADLPVDAADEVVPSAKAAGVAPIFIVSPMTTAGRFAEIAGVSEGYVYVVSRLGITGTEERYDEHLKDLIRKTKESIKLPACVGFGVSSPEQASNMISLGADGVICGSRVVEVIREDRSAPYNNVRTFVEHMVAATNLKLLSEHC